MALWPRDERINGSDASKLRTGLAKEQYRDYPYIGQGLIGATTLLQTQDQHLKWAFLNQPSSYTLDCVDKRIKLGKRIELYSPASLETIAKPLDTVRQRAEQGANFLRTYVPDAEIPEELIRAHLVEDATWSRQMQVFDPYEGNNLAIVYDAVPQIPSLLVFPTGEIKNHLSYLQLQYSEFGIAFETSAVALHKFTTPIRQIVSNKPKTNTEDSLLAVRTFSAVEVFSVKQSAPSPQATRVVDLTQRNTNGEDIVDIVYAVGAPEVTAVSNRGTLFSYDIKSGGTTSVIFSDAMKTTGPDNELWRLTSYNHSQSLLTTDSKVLQIDHRIKSSSDFLSLPTGRNIFTSAGDVQDNIVCLCTTENVIWMDIRSPRKPLISYTHNRQYDRYLSVLTLTGLTDNSVTLLTSRDNSMVQVFDIKQASEEPIKFHIPPYTIPSDLGSYHANIGQCYVRHKEYAGLLSLSPTGAVSYTEIIPLGIHAESLYSLSSPNDETEIVTNNYLQPNVGPLEVREHSEADLYSAYEALFQEHFNGVKEMEDENAEAIYQMLDFFPSYFQNKEFPTESMLTTYDVAFRAGDEPKESKGADFLANSLICSKRGFRAMKQGKLSPELVKSAWSRSIVTTLQEMDNDFAPNVLGLVTNLNRYKLSSEQYTSSSKAREYEQETVEQLALDLTLSSNIYSEFPFTHREEKIESLECMTEALSLGSSPPQVQFGYLKPIKPAWKGHYDKWAQNDSVNIPSGVCSLLQAWDSMSMDDYIYEDPYGQADISTQTSTKKPKTVTPLAPTVTQTQRPPQILTTHAATAQPDILIRRAMPPVISSQRVNTFPEQRADLAILEDSQPSQSSFPEIMVSTQVLPGPHGGRPAPKKKPAKKRLGGF